MHEKSWNFPSTVFTCICIQTDIKNISHVCKVFYFLSEISMPSIKLKWLLLFSIITLFSIFICCGVIHNSQGLFQLCRWGEALGILKTRTLYMYIIAICKYSWIRLKYANFKGVHKLITGLLNHKSMLNIILCWTALPDKLI